MPTLTGVQTSGFVWMNLGAAAELLTGFATTPAMQRFVAVREPSLVTFNGETERIQVASRTRLTSLMLDTMMNLGASGKQTK
jgi:hypothetical protein